MIMKCTADTKLGAVLLVLALLAGPAGAQDKAAAAPQNSGFLADYSKLAPAPDNPAARRWINKDFDFKPYKQILLDPVEVWMSPTSQYKGAPPEVLKRMTDNFTNSFRKALQPGYQLVDKAGPGVLHVRLAITGINLTKPPMKPYQVLPIMAIASAASSSKVAVLTGEMQVLDPDNNVVAAAVNAGTGDESFGEKDEITWKQLQSITDNWAKNLRKRLDEARGVTPKS
jgi:hypothetical protein